ncbi:MAG: hypothetical protein RIF33_13560 [Cyclobacteriaceae bacterium]
MVLALAIWMAGYFHTGKYVRPKWKIPGKLAFYLLVSASLIYFFNYYALIFILGHPLLGLVFHIKVCNKHDINWTNCAPKEKYLELQEKWARGEFD